jgi:hypothetical protein
MRRSARSAGCTRQIAKGISLKGNCSISSGRSRLQDCGRELLWHQTATGALPDPGTHPLSRLRRGGHQAKRERPRSTLADNILRITVTQNRQACSHQYGDKLIKKLPSLFDLEPIGDRAAKATALRRTADDVRWEYGETCSGLYHFGVTRASFLTKRTSSPV